MTCFSGEVTFEIIKSELGNVAPEYTGPQYPEIQDYFTTTLINDIVNNGVSAADALAAAQVEPSKPQPVSRLDPERARVLLALALRP